MIETSAFLPFAVVVLVVAAVAVVAAVTAVVLAVRDARREHAVVAASTPIELVRAA